MIFLFFKSIDGIPPFNFAVFHAISSIKGIPTLIFKLINGLEIFHISKPFTCFKDNPINGLWGKFPLMIVRTNE